jgi:hypothetical protein
MLQCRRRLLAPNGHAAVVPVCRLLRDERTLLRRDLRSVDDLTQPGPNSDISTYAILIIGW